MCCKHIVEAFSANEKCLTEGILHAEEGKKRFEIELPKGSKETFCCIHVDDSPNDPGLIQDNKIKKCDYWIVRCKNAENYFIEFKGSDIKEGFEQIIETIYQAKKNQVELPKNQVSGFVIANKVPLATTEVQNLKETFRKKHGKVFVVKSKIYVHIL